MNLLTLDLGTSVLKAGWWRQGTLVAERTAVLPMHTAGPVAEQDATLWWPRVVALVRDLAPLQVDGIGVTAQMHALVPMDGAGQPLAPVPTVMDRRARAETAELAAAPGWRVIHELTGGRLDATSVLPKLRHLSRQPEGAAWQKAAWLLPPKDYLRFRLTGVPVTDPTDAAGTLLWNLRSGAWEPSLIALAGIRKEQLPPVQPTLSRAGTLRADAARELGLTAGIPVVTGGGDDIETLGAGVLAPGDFFEHCGTTGSIYLATDQWRLDAAGAVETYPDIVAGRWLLGASTTTAGAALAWARRVLALPPTAGDPSGLPVIGERPGELLFLPFLAGERGPWWNPELTGRWLGLRPEHAATDLYRAVAEGVLFALNSLLEVLQPYATGNAGMIHTSGPLGLDPQAAQARADLYGRTVCRRGHQPQTTAAAAALLTEAALTGADPYALAAARLPPAWIRHPGPAASAWRAAARRYHQAVLDALQPYPPAP